MSYKITDLDMNWFREMEKEIMIGFEEMKMKLEKFKIQSLNIENTKVSIGNKDFQTPITGELYQCFKYIRGQGRIDYLREITQSIAELIWVNPFIIKSNYAINWSDWLEKKHGYLVKMCFNRDHLISGQNLTITELAMLSGSTKSNIGKKIGNGINENKVSKDGKRKYIDNEECIKYLKDQEIEIYDSVEQKTYKPYKNI